MRLTSSTRQKKASIFDLKDHRAMAELHLGDRFLIKLPENPEIGYGWDLDTPPGTEVIDSWFAPTNISRPLAGGYHYWRIRGVSPGRHFFQANCRLRNITGNLPSIVFQLQINVSPG